MKTLVVLRHATAGQHALQDAEDKRSLTFEPTACSVRFIAKAPSIACERGANECVKEGNG
eukprot:6192626-Pleurochrysis_carterae.AAC.1